MRTIPQPTARLQIHLLGTFHVALDGAPLAGLRSDKARALLAYLAVERTGPHRRERLATLLWGEASEQAARASLRTTLLNLRQALAGLHPPLLVITRHTVHLAATDDCWVDAAEFGALLDACDAHPHRALADCPDCVPRLEQAVALYRGDFLAGLLVDAPDFEEWRLLQQETLHARALTALAALTAYHLGRGRYARVQQYARRQLALEPWNEEAHRQLMRALAGVGQRSAALAQYETCCHALREALGVEPSPETRTLYEEIRAQSPAVPIEIAPGASPAPLWPVEPIPTTAGFVGRAEEMAYYRESLDAQNLAVLHGFAGSGKTALAAQLAAERRQSGGPVIWITFYTGINTDLDSFLRSLACALEAQGDPRLRAFLAADAPGQSSYPSDAAINYAVNCLSANQVVLCLDDVHLVEGVAEIRRFFDLLAPRQQPARTPLIVSSRSLPGFAQGRHILPLSGLSDADALCLLQSANAAWLEDSFAALQQRIEGNPAFLKFFIAWAQASGVAELPPPERTMRTRAFIEQLGRSPDSSRFLLQESLAALRPAERAALERAALCRKPLPLVDAALDILFPDWKATEVRAVFAGLEKKNLLMRMGSAAAYRPHELLRNFVASQLEQQSDRQMELHGLLARYHEAVGDVVEAAYHHCRAVEPLAAVGLLTDHAGALLERGLAAAIVALAVEIPARQLPAERRLAWYRTLAAAWQVSGRYDAAAAQYLGDLLAQTPESAYAERYALLLAREKVYSMRGEREAQRRDLEALEELAAAAGAGTQQANILQAEVSFRYTEYARAMGDFAAAIAAARRAIALAQAGEDVALEMQGYLHLAPPYINQGMYNEARECLEQALALARQNGARRAEAAGLYKLGGVLYYLGQNAQARTCWEQALQRYRELGDRAGEGITLGNLGFLADAQGNPDEAIVHYRESLRLVREINDREMEAWMLTNLGNLLANRGDYAQALTHYRDALHIARQIGDRLGESSTLGDIGFTYLALGDYAQAGECLDLALQGKRDIGDRHGEGIILSGMGLLAHLQGRESRAEELTRQALSIGEALDNCPIQGYAWTCLGHALTGLGRLAEAVQAYQRASNLRREAGQPHLAIEALAGLAGALLHQGDTAQALAQVEGILAYLASGTPDGTDEPLRIYLTCYRVLQAAGDPRAEHVLSAAYGLLQERAARITDEEMRRSYLENVPTHREIVAAWQGARGWARPA